MQFFTTSAAAWEAELTAIGAAHKTIDIESFIFMYDAIGVRFLEALAERAAAGVRVRCIFDAVGSIKSVRRINIWCKDKHIAVRFFHRFFLGNKKTPLWKRMFQRTHRKAIIIDGTQAFVGGVNIEEAHHEWRDLHVLLTGAPVEPIRETFERTWQYLHHGYLKRAKTRVGERLQFIGRRLTVTVWPHGPDQETFSFRKLFKHLLKSAKKRCAAYHPLFFSVRAHVGIYE